jgi:hypothetical protein
MEKAVTTTIRRQRKEERLGREAEAARRKNLQTTHILENSIKRRARERVTINQ